MDAVNNIQIFYNPLDAASVERYSVPVGTPIIAFLAEHFPLGFDGHLQVLVGRDPIDLGDLDYEIQECDLITLLVMPSFEGLAITATQVLLSAAISTAIGFVINLIFKPSVPGTPNIGEESPVYSLSPTRNTARLGEPIPVHYGTVSFPPDFASAPYSFFFEGSNDQYVDELLTLGHGTYDVTDIFVGDTPVSAMAPGTVQYWLFSPQEHNQTFGNIPARIWQAVRDTQTPWPFQENTFTSPEVESWEFNADRTESTTAWAPISGSAYAAGVDPLTNQYLLGRIENVDSAITIKAGDTVSLQNTTSNNGDFVVGSVVPDPLGGPTQTIFEQWGQNFISDEQPLNAAAEYQLNIVADNLTAGPFRAQKEGQSIESVDCDIVFPNGLYRVDGNTGNIKVEQVQMEFSYQQIDPLDGTPIGVPVTRQAQWDSKSRSPLRSTVRSGILTQGAYEVTVRRITPIEDDNRIVDQVLWVGLKGNVVQDVTQTAYGPVTMLAVRLKATNGLGTAAQNRIRVDCRRTLSSGDSENPVRIIKDIWTNSDYGMGRPLSGLDTATLDPLETQWDGPNGPLFNGGFDQRSTGLEAMQSVASLTAGKIVQDGGLTTLVVDKKQPVRAAMFSSGNIVQGSMKVVYTFDTEGDYDGVIVEYRDPLTFDAEYITYPTTATNPESFFLFGCTDFFYAEQYAIYLWQVRSKRRKQITFTTELEGLLPTFGSRIAMSHPLCNWGQSGVMVEEINQTTWRVDQYLNWSINNVMMLRDQTGQPSNLLPVTRGFADNIVVFDQIPPLTVSDQQGIEPTSYVFGDTVRNVRDFILSGIRPKGDNQVEIEGQTYDETIFDGAMPHLVI